MLLKEKILDCFFFQISYRKRYIRLMATIYFIVRNMCRFLALERKEIEWGYLWYLNIFSFYFSKSKITLITSLAIRLAV